MGWGILFKLGLVSMLVLGVGAQASSQAFNQGSTKTVVLPEDEFVLPPLLRGVDGGSILNVESAENKKRSAAVGEWLEYGDSVRLPARLAFQVIPRENIQWVGGGVFEGKIGDRVWKKEESSPYIIHLTRGWMKVCAKPDLAHHKIQILTNTAMITAERAVFWISTRPGLTEVYLLEGEIQDSSGQSLRGKNFYSWQGENAGDKTIKFASKDWDEKPLEVRIAGLYPDFVRLSTRARDEWEKGKTESVYKDLRRAGWRKASRLSPKTGHSK